MDKTLKELHEINHSLSSIEKSLKILAMAIQNMANIEYNKALKEKNNNPYIKSLARDGIVYGGDYDDLK